MKTIDIEPNRRMSEKARKNTHDWVGAAMGWVMLVFMIPFSIIGWAFSHFSKVMKWVVGAVMIFFSLFWSTENYFMALGQGSLQEAIASLSFSFSMLISFFVAALIQTYQFESAKERKRDKELKDVDNFKANKIAIYVGYALYAFEVVICLRAIGLRIDGGGIDAVFVALVIGFVSIFGFEIGTDWVESKE